MNRVNVGVNTDQVRRASREASPIPVAQYNQLMKALKPGQYVVIQNLPGNQPQHHLMRNLLTIGGIGGGLAGLYHYRQPIMKLGQRVINYTTDKFHNLFQSNNTTEKPTPTPTPTPHFKLVSSFCLILNVKQAK